MTRQELENKKDKIIMDMRELNEQLKMVENHLANLAHEQNNKPEIVYNNYKTW